MLENYSKLHDNINLCHSIDMEEPRIITVWRSAGNRRALLITVFEDKLNLPYILENGDSSLSRALKPDNVDGENARKQSLEIGVAYS